MKMLGKYFSGSEFACHHCGELPESGIDSNLIALLDRLREKICVPIFISSGYRCPPHNAREGGVRNSQHVLGTGADCVQGKLSVDDFAELACETAAEMGLEVGVGRYWTAGFVHIDTRGYTARWTEDD